MQANWIFANEYFKTATMMPYTLKNEPIPTNKIKKNMRVYKVLSVLNFLLPLFEGISYFCFSFCFAKGRKCVDNTSAIYTGAVFGVLALEIVSGVFLGCAIAKVRNYIKNSKTQDTK